MTRKGFLIDTSLCTGCRGCQVACKQWNKLPAGASVNRGSYENPPQLTPQLFNQIHFVESEKDGAMQWLFLNRRCMHCAEAGCIKVCPSAGALYHTPEGMVAYNRDKCTECHYCVNACPFDVPRYDAENRVTKCHACSDRIASGLLPACAKGCPTGALQFGDRAQLLSKAKSSGKPVYGENDLGGTGVLYLLSDTAHASGLPENPAIPTSIFLWKDVIKPFGILGFWGAIGAVVLHYVTVGPKRLEEDESTAKQNEGGKEL